MIATPRELARELHARGLVAQLPAADHVAGENERPWYIALLLGTAGWFAGIFLLFFVFMLFKPDSGASALLEGFVLLAAAWTLFAVDRDGAFVSQLALALSVAGQFALVFGVHETLFKPSGSIASVAFVALLLQLALTAAMPNRMHRTMTTLFACVAWAIVVRYGLWDQPTWAGRAAEPAPSLALALVGWAIAWVPVGGALFLLIRREPAWMSARRQGLVRPIITGLIAGLAVATLLSHPLDSFSWRNLHPRESWLALWPLLSALASLGALAAAFALGSRGLMAVCIVAALMHVSHFYYALGTSLLIKSIAMGVLGAILLGVAHMLKQRRSP